MEAIRTTIDSERLALIIDLPESMRHQSVELIVLPQTQETDNTKMQPEKSDDRSGILSLMGCLNEYADPELRKLEKGAWARAAAEKHLEKMKDDCTNLQ